MICSAIVLSLVAVAFARPQQPTNFAPQGTQGNGATPIPIVSQTEEINPDGSFKFSYETANGIKFEESGYLKDNGTEDKIQVIQGSVSYTDNDGKVINLKYIADENGFQPEGDHIPTSPEAVGRNLQPGGQPAGIQAQSQPGQSGQFGQAARPAQPGQPGQFGQTTSQPGQPGQFGQTTRQPGQLAGQSSGQFGQAARQPGQLAQGATGQPAYTEPSVSEGTQQP